jgi:hypothetical protein
MPHVRFAVGTLLEGGIGGPSRLAFVPFPLVDLNDPASGGYVAPAVAVDLLDLVRWFWRVKTWAVDFDTPLNDLGFNDQNFNSTAVDEIDLMSTVPFLSVDETMNFLFIVVLDPVSGGYFLQSNLEAPGSLLMSLTSATGDTLVFEDSDGNHATAVEAGYWDYAD